MRKPAKVVKRHSSICWYKKVVCLFFFSLYNYIFLFSMSRSLALYWNTKTIKSFYLQVHLE